MLEQKNNISFREKLFEISKEEQLEKREKMFFDELEIKLKNAEETRLPAQLFETLFNLDFHRGVIHVIPLNIVRKFKAKGFRVAKIRNKHQVKVKKL